MKRKSDTSKNNIYIVRSCKGSIEQIRKNKTSRGVFFCEDYPEKGKVILIENVKGYKESIFDSLEEVSNYIDERYGE